MCSFCHCVAILGYYRHLSEWKPTPGTGVYVLFSCSNSLRFSNHPGATNLRFNYQWSMYLLNSNLFICCFHVFKMWPFTCSIGYVTVKKQNQREEQWRANQFYGFRFKLELRRKSMKQKLLVEQWSRFTHATVACQETGNMLLKSK